MAKDIRQRIRDSFVGEPVADVKDYADKIYSLRKDASGSITKSVILAFVLMAIFELLAYQNSAGSFTIGSFSFAKTSVTQIVLPTVVAYIVYDATRITYRLLDLEIAYTEIMKIVAPKMEENDVDIFLRPVLPSIWNIGTSSRPANRTSSEKLFFPIDTTFGLIAFAALPVAFEVQAFYRLTEKYGLANIFLWINAFISLMLIICAGLNYFTDD